MTSSNPQSRIGTSFLTQLVTLRSKKGAVQMEDVGAIFESMAQALGNEASQQAAILRSEITKMAHDIEEAKREIFALSPKEGSAKNINDASDHLGAIVKGTEDATNSILNAADELQALAGALDADAKGKLEAIIGKIYEACNFQDLTTQRISKVTAALDYIDTKVSKLAKLFSDASSDVDAKQEIKAKDTRADSHLMNGPAEKPPTQAEIDALFASMKTGTN